MNGAQREMLRQLISERRRKLVGVPNPCRTCGEDRGKNAAFCSRKCAALARWETRRVWTPEGILEAIRAWADEHGSAPAMVDWDSYKALHSTSDPARAERAARLVKAQRVPCRNTVIHHFGSWNAAIAAAGLPTRRQGVRAA